MSNIHASHFDWITNDDGLNIGAVVTTHFTRHEIMREYLRLQREDPKCVEIYEGEFLTICKVAIFNAEDIA